MIKQGRFFSSKSFLPKETKTLGENNMSTEKLENLKQFFQIFSF